MVFGVMDTECGQAGGFATLPLYSGNEIEFDDLSTHGILCSDVPECNDLPQRLSGGHIREYATGYNFNIDSGREGGVCVAGS
jgi:hypothetical protein